MTEERIREIADEWGCDWYICQEAMKQAVNEALDEAANNADIICANAKKGSDTCGAWCGGCDSATVNKQSILNLKVK